MKVIGQTSSQNQVGSRPTRALAAVLALWILIFAAGLSVFAADPEITVQPANAAVCAGGTANLSVTASGTAPLTYQWYQGPDIVPGGTSATLAIPNAQAGTAGGYTVVVTNDLGAVTSVVATLTINPLPSATVNSATICAGGSAALTATTDAANPTYLWSPGGETTAAITVSPASTTIYSVTVTDGNTTCSASASGTVTVTPLPTASVNSATVCAGGSATLTATTDAANPTYAWSPGGATTASIDVSPAATTIYTVTVTDGTTTCSVSASGTVTITPLPAVSVNNAVICGSGSAILTATTDAANPTYAWSPGGDTTASITVSPASTTIYTVTVTDGTTTCSASASGTVTVSALPTVSVNSATICAGASATLTATTDATTPTYLWSPGGETTAAITVSPASTTIYSVTVTDATTTCANSASGTVTVTPLPTASVNSVTVCAGASATLTATTDAANPTYAWSPGGQTTAAITVSPAATTTYTVTVTDGTTACAASAQGTVTVTPLPTVTVNSATICPGASATLTATTDAANPTYLWSPGGQTTAAITVSPVATATYTVTVTDGVTGCAGSGSGTVTVRGFDAFANASSITINDNAAAAPYPSTISVAGLTATVCRVTVTLNNLSHSYPDDLDIILVGPNGVATYLMSDVGGFDTINNATLTFDDLAGASLPDEAQVVSGTFKPSNIGSKKDGRLDEFPAPAPVGPYQTNLAIFSGINPNGAWSLYVLDDQIEDGGVLAGGWSLSIATLEPFADAAITQADAPDPVGVGSNLTYTVTVANNGPSPSAGLVLTDTLPAGVTFVSASASQGSCSQAGGIVTCLLGTVNPGAVATATIVVAPTAVGTLVNQASLASSTIDFVTANNAASTTTTVLEPPAITAPPANVAVCVGGSATFTVTATGAAPLSYQWFFGDVELAGATSDTLNLASAQLADAGTYTVVVSNPVGAARPFATLTVNPLPVVSVNSPTICFGAPAVLTATHNAANPTFLWTPGGATTPFITVSPASTTTYTVLVTDGVTGCANTAQGTVTVIPLPIVSVNSPAICSGDSATLTATSDAANPSYLWSPGGETTPSITVTPASDTTYTVTVTDGTTTCANSASGTAKIAALPINWAVSGVATQSSTYQFTAVASRAIDGVTDGVFGNGSVTHTSANPDVGGGLDNERSWQVDLGSEKPIALIKLWLRTDCCGERNTNLAVRVYNGAYAMVYATTNRTGTAFTTPLTFNLPAPVNGRYVQVQTLAAANLMLSLAEVQAYSPLNGSVVSVTVPPASVTVPELSPVTLGPVAGTVTPSCGYSYALDYQWQRNGANISGATSPAYTFTPTVAANNGDQYSVILSLRGAVATLPGATATSAVATVTVTASAPLITTQPVSTSTPMGNSATFSVVGLGTLPLSYQWLSNGVAILDATNASYTTPNLAFGPPVNYQVVVSNASGSVTSAVAVLTIAPIYGISFDFDSPGQFTNAPYYLTWNNWINGSFQNPPAIFESSYGGVGPFPGSGSLDLVSGNGSENSSIILAASYDFSLSGKVLNASTMFKVKNPTASNRSTQIGFVTATNSGVNDVAGQGFSTVIVQSTAQPAPTYELRHQRRNSGGGIAENTLTGTASLTVSNWYKLSITYTNTRTTGTNSYNIGAVLQDMGPLGDTPGATVLSFVVTTNICDIATFKNVYLAIRGADNTGVEARDNTCVWTTPGNIFWVQQPQNQTVLQGRRVAFKALVDGEGPYTYQWFKNDVAIPGARDWKYVVPSALTTDNGSQYKVQVTGPFNTITSEGATLTVQPETLAVVSAGSVDGTTVGVKFSQPVDQAGAENVANYSINGTAPVAARVYRSSLGPLGPEGIYVILTPSSVLSGAFSVTVSGVKDLSGGLVGAANAASGSVANLTGYDVNPLLTGPPGENYSFGPGQFIVTGGGADLFSGGDGFRFVYTTRTGDFDLVTRIPYMDSTRFSAKAGFDARASLDPYSVGVAVAFDPGPIAEGSGTLRQFTEGTAKLTWGAGGTSWGNATRLYHPDVWLRMRRVGNTFLRYSSTNGVDWLFDGQISPNPTLPSTLYVGLAVCAARNLQAESVQFENVSEFGGYPGAAIAIVLPPASFTVAAGSSYTVPMLATLTGGGAPNRAGELTYHWQRNDGSGNWTNLVAGGVTNNQVSIGPFFSSDSGAQFRCILKAPGAADVTTPVFTATVTDTAVPTITSVGVPVLPAYPASEVLVYFSEPMSAATALNFANYAVTNAAGVRVNVIGAAFLSGDPRTVALKVDAILGTGTASVGISGVRDQNNNLLATAVRTFRTFDPPTAPVVVEVYQDIAAGTAITDLTGNALYTAGTPTYIVYSNLFGFNVVSGFASSQDNYGVKAYTYFVPPTNGNYKFWIRSDDAMQLWMNTNGPSAGTPAASSTVLGSSANYPAAEAPASAIDHAASTKYLNFDKLNTGFTVELAQGAKVVTSVRFTTANDAPERDPLTFTLDGASSTNGPWTTIAASLSTGLDTDPGRLTQASAVSIANATAYAAYRITFPTVRDANVANSMQIAEVWLQDAGGNDVTAPVLSGTLTLIAENTGANGNYSVGTTPANSVTNVTLVANQRYYLMALLKEGAGGDGFSAMWTDPTVNTAPAVTVLMPTTALAYPAQAAPSTPVVMELYTGYQNFLAGYNQLAGLYAATNFPTGSYALDTVNYNYIAGNPAGFGYQKFFGVQPGTLGNTRFDNYLGRVMSYFIAPSNGLYRFWIAVDDVAQLWMNTNAVNSTDPAGKVLLGQSANAFVSTASQLVAQNVPLIGGQKYYLEALYREGGGGDGVRVAVRSQGDTATPPVTEVIPASMLEYPLPMGRAGAVNFTHIAPVNPTVTDGRSITLCVAGLAGAPPYGGFIWLKNGVPVFLNSITNVIGPVTMADNGAVYTVIVTNQFSRVERSTTLTVVPDGAAPAVARCVGWRYGDGFTVQYSEPVNAATATYLGNYQVSGGLALLRATLDPTRTQVSISTAPQAPGTTYTVTINGVRDASSAGNVIAPNTTAAFSTWSVGGSGTLVELWTNIQGTAILDLSGTTKYQANLPDVSYYTNVFAIGAFAANTGLENYGARVSGYFVPTNTGLYRFYIRSDDASQLWMNTNPTDSENPAGRTMLIHMPGANQNINSPNAMSPPVSLNQGQRYYIEGLLKEGTGGDYFQMTFRACDANGTAVGTAPVDNTVAENIPAAGYFDGAPGNPDAITIVSTPPAEIFATENDAITIALNASMPANVRAAGSFQWQKSDGASFTNIPGANGAGISFTARLPDDSAQYKLVVSFPGLSRTYVTLLHVAVDENPPEIVSVGSVDGKSFAIRYRRAVDPSSATDPVNYDLNRAGGFSIVGPTGTMADDRTVVFPLAPESYIVGETFIVDGYSINSAAANPIAADVFAEGRMEFLTPQDIGTPGTDPLLAGSTFTVTNGTFTMKAGGHDIWDAADGFHMAYRAVTGNFDVKVRVESLVGPNTWTKAGLMVRASTNGNSRFIDFVVTPTLLNNPAGQNRYTFQWRDTDGAGAAYDVPPEPILPPLYPNAWVRLQRVGSVFNAYSSSDGANWSFFSSRDTAANAGGAYPDTVLLGMVLTSHDNTAAAALATAEFRNLDFPLPPTITMQPTPAAVVIGVKQSVTFGGLAAVGTGPFSYQWRKDGVALAGATSASLNIPNTAVTDSGAYTVLLGNNGGAVVSTPCVLTVTNGLPIVVGETNYIVQGGFASDPVQDLLANDTDPEGDLLSVIAVSGLPPASFSANFDDGLVPTGSAAYGAAGGGYVAPTDGVAGSGVLKLTDAVGSQAGSLIINALTPGKRVSGFTASFMLRIGGGTAEPADGFSFNFGNDLPDAATTGAAAEQGGTATGVSFCVDNYRFLPIAIGAAYNNVHGGAAEVANTSGLKINYNGIIIAGVQIPTWASTRYVPVSITVTPQGVATVMVDDTNVFGNITLPNYTPTQGRFGLYARTGGATETHWVDDLAITQLTLDTARDYVVGPASRYGSTYITPTGGVDNSGMLRLTDNVNGQAGSFIIDELTPGAAVQSFNASFKLRIGDGTGNAADGFSMNLAGDLPNAAAGATAAEEGVGTGLSVCVDNYPTGGADSPSFKLKLGGVQLGFILIPKWNSPSWIPVNISLQAGGLLTVTVDGTNVIENLPMPYTPIAGRFGFFARTGGENETHWLDDISINVIAASGQTGFYTQDFNRGGPGTVTLVDGVVTYTPPPNVCGTDSYYYIVSDGQLGGQVVDQKTVVIWEQTPEAPYIVQCANNVTVSAAADCQALVPDFTRSLNVTDNCCCVNVTQIPAAGTPVGFGAHTVTLTATDTMGLSSECTATLTVVDGLGPVLTCPAPLTLNADAACKGTLPDLKSQVLATDCTPPITITQDPAPGTLLDPGTYSVTFGAVDNLGNSNYCVMSVEVKDTTAPSVTCPGSVTLNVNPGSQVPLPDLVTGLVASDNCGIASKTQAPPAGTLVGVGPASIVITVADTAGNVTTCNVSVMVVVPKYVASVLAESPIAYYRFSETAQPSSDNATNIGTLGAAANGPYLNKPAHDQAGALAGSTDKAIAFDGTSQGAQIPYSAALNPVPPFTVEGWAKPLTNRPAGSALVCPFGSLRRVTPAAEGWIIYQDPAGWNFRLGDSTNNYTVSLTGGGEPASNTWYHLVMTYDGAEAICYVNGVEIGRVATNNFVPNPSVPLGIGMRGDAAFFYPGTVDEVAVYPNILSATDVADHYQNGINPTPAVPYNDLVLAKNPVAYYRLDEPTLVFPKTLNLGSLGPVADGTYYPGTTAGVAGPQEPQFIGFGTDNLAFQFNGTSGYVSTLAGMLNGLPKVTLTGWIRRDADQANRTGLFGQNDLVEFGYIDNNTIQAWIDNNGNAVNVTPNPFPNGEWDHVAMVLDSGALAVYTNALLAGTANLGTSDYGTNGYSFNIAGGGIFDVAGNFFNGAIDEVAVYDKALSQATLANQYFSAVATPAAIVQNLPATTNIYLGDTLTLSIVAVGTPTLRYQWYFFGEPIPDQTNGSLVIPDVPTDVSGPYYCEVRNDYGSPATSVPCEVTVLDLPPTIVQQPAPATAYAGYNASFTVVASGALSYQWKKGDTDIPGATGATLTLTAVQPGNAGAYKVVVSNLGGSTESDPATLTVLVPQAGTYEGAVLGYGPVDYWQLNEAAGSTVAYDYVGGRNGTVSGGVTFGVPGPVPPSFGGFPAGNTAAQFDGVSGLISASPSPVNAVNAFTMVGWMNLSATPGGRVALWGQNDVLEFGFHNAGIIGMWSPTGGFIEYNYPFTLNQWYFVATTGDGASMSIYINGNLIVKGGGTASPNYGNSGYPFNIGAAVLDASGNFFNGVIDQVVVYNKALTAQEICSLYVSGTEQMSQMLIQPVNVVVQDDKPLGVPHDGVDYGAAWVASSTDAASVTRTGVMEFMAAEGDQITIAAAPEFDSTQGTITFWMRSAGISGGGSEGAILFDRRTSTGDVIVQTDGGKIFVQANDNGGANSFSTTASVSDDRWHLVTYVYDQSAAGSISIYIDGVLDKSQANSKAWRWPVGQRVELGRSHDGYWRLYNGQMDDFRIYNRMLSAAEVSQIYTTGGLVDTTALQVQFNFDAAPAGVAISWSGCGTLQQTDDLRGNGAETIWTDVVGASTPYYILQRGEMKFYRVKQ